MPGLGEPAGETTAREGGTAPRPDSYYWAAGLLKESGANVNLVHPLGLHWDTRRVKNDVKDAIRAGQRLCRGDLPEAWVAPPELRDLRELVRYRKLSRYRHKARYAEDRIMPSFS